MSERLHKLLAQHGLGSRREIEKWMLAGRVLLNGKPAQPGDRFDSGDRVTVDGQDVSSRLRVTRKAAVIVYHKPQGQPVAAPSLSSDAPMEESSGETVMERLPSVRGSRWLVINTMQAGDSGLLILTSDGRLADALRRRSEQVPSAYVARVLVPTPEFDLKTLPHSVRLDEQTVDFVSIEPAGGEGTNRWFRVDAAHAHRRAAVRALFETNGLKVSRVIQVRFADIELPRDLPRGKHRALTDEQVERLYEFAELEQPIESEAPRHGRSGSRSSGRGARGRTPGRNTPNQDAQGRVKKARPRKSSNRPSRPPIPEREADARSGGDRSRSRSGPAPAGRSSRAGESSERFSSRSDAQGSPERARRPGGRVEASERSARSGVSERAKRPGPRSDAHRPGRAGAGERTSADQRGSARPRRPTGKRKSDR